MNTHIFLAVFILATIVAIQSDDAAGDTNGDNAVQGSVQEVVEGTKGDNADTTGEGNQVSGDGTATAVGRKEEGPTAKGKNDQNEECTNAPNKALTAYLNSILGPETGGGDQEVENKVQEQPLECTLEAINKSRELFTVAPKHVPCHPLMFKIADPDKVTEDECLKGLADVNNQTQNHIEKVKKEAKKARGYGCSINGPLGFGFCCLLQEEQSHRKQMIQISSERDQSNPKAAATIDAVNNNQHISSVTK